MKINKIINLEIFISFALLLIMFTKLRFIGKMGIGELSLIFSVFLGFFILFNQGFKIFKKISSYIFITLTYFVFILFISLINYYELNGVILSDSLAYLISLTFILMLSLLDNFNLKKSLVLFVIFFIASSYLILFLSPSSFSFYLNSRFSGFSNNPNQLAFGVIISQVIIFAFLKIEIKSLILLILLFILGFITGSDAYLFSTLLSYYLVIFFISLKFLKLNNSLSLFIILLSSSIFLILISMFYEIENLKSLWSIYDEDNTRINLYKYGIESWLSNPVSFLFGNGFGRFSGIDYSFQFREAHNTLIDVLNNFGLVGFFIIFIPFLGSMIKILINKNYLFIFVIFSFFLYINFHMVSRQPYFWLIWYLIIIYSYNFKYKNK